MSASDIPHLNLREQIARIDRAIAGTHKFQAETDKLFEEARKFRRDRWSGIITAIAALIGALGGSAIYQALVSAKHGLLGP